MSLNHLTTGNDLSTIISNCTKCSVAIDHGENIVCHDQLPFLKIHKKYQFSQKQKALIVNSSNSQFEQNSNDSIGHWFVLLLSSNKTIYMCDGLGYIKTRTDVMDNIKKFCRINKHKFLDVKIRAQTSNSNNCGLIATFWIAKFTTMEPKQFNQFLKVLQRNSIQTNEKIALKCVQKHFHVNL